MNNSTVDNQFARMAATYHTCGGTPGCAPCFAELHAKIAAVETRAEEAERACEKADDDFCAMHDQLTQHVSEQAQILRLTALAAQHIGGSATLPLTVSNLFAQLAAANAEIERLRGTTRAIDGKFAVRGGVIVKVTSGEVVPEDEPLVLMRGRDRLMVATLGHYRRLCQLDGCNDFQLGLVDELIAKFVAYANDPSRMKQPGVTRGAAWSGGHSDDCPSRRGGECTYPCYMQPTTTERS